MTCPKTSGGWRMAQLTNPTKESHRIARPPRVQTSLRLVVVFIVPFLSLRGRVHFQIALRGDSESVGDPIEEGEHGGDVNRLGNLRLSPTMLAQALDVCRRGTVRRLGHLGYVIEKSAFRRGQLGFVELSL